LQQKLIAKQIDRFIIEFKMKHKHGHWVDILSQAKAVFDNNGKAIRIVGTHTDITDRKSAEEALRESKQKTELLLNVAAEIIISIDSHGDIALLNDSGHRIFGYETPELVGKNWFDTCLPVEERKEIRKYFGLLLEGESTSLVSHESDVVTKNGERKTILWHNSLLKDKDGKGVGLFSSGEDITDRKKSEEILRESEKKYKNLYESIIDGVVSSDLNGTITSSNIIFQKMLGYTADELLSMKFRDITPEKWWAFEDTLIAKELNGKDNTGSYEKEYRRKDGSICPVELSAFAMKDEENNISCLWAIVRDITERKKIENILHDSETKYSKIFKESPFPIMLIDTEKGCFADVNEAMSNSTGYSMEELIGKSDVELGIISPESEIKLKRLIAETGQYSDVEVSIKTKTGEIRFGMATGRIVELNKHPYLIQTIVDITERKKIEADLVSQRRLYEQILEQSLAGYWDWDIPSGDQYLSPTFKKMFGYEDHEIENRADSWQKLIFAEDLPSVYGKFKSYVESREKAPFYNEVRYHHKDGATVWVICTGKIIEWDDDGNAKRMIGCHIDITERKKIEKELQEQEQKYRLITEHSADVIWVLSIKTGRFKFISPSIFQLRGFTSEEAMAETVEETMTPESIVIVKETMARDYKYYLEHPDSPRHNLIEIQQYCKNGDVIWVEVSTINYLNSVGDIEVIGSSRNIEERKKNEQALRNSESKVMSLLAEKELILKEVHHRIKNNMNTVSSLLSIQSRNTSEPMSILALDDARNRIQSMSILYDKLYRSQDYTELSFKNYLSSVIDEVIANFPNSQMVKVEKEIQDFILDIKRLQSLGIIVNELITNIMKYAFKNSDKGLIIVTVTKKNRQVAISVQDDGIGIPESIGFENSTGFGLQLVQALTQQLNGTIRIERGNGTKVVLEFNI